VDDWLLGIYQAELRTQCEFMVMGARFVDGNLGPGGNGTAVWFGLQGILVAASNASKMFWGSRQEPVIEARRPLRESVAVDDQSPLSSRKVRNDFEHFDERLEDWFATSSNHNYLGRNIGPPDMIVIADQVPTDHFGHFDPSTAIVSFWENSADLRAIVAEAERILARLNEIKDRGSRPSAP
jgi:hypothetical protein